MIIRTAIAVVIGILLGLTISAVWYLNDFVIRQTFLVGNMLPVAVFGVIVAAVIFWNPLVGWIHESLTFRGRELAIIAALGLAVCGWTGSGYLRYFCPTTALPTFWLKDNPSWQSANVMSYVPGGSFELAEGHISDWPAFCKKIMEGANQDAPSPAKKIWGMLTLDAQAAVQEGARTGRISPQKAQKIITALNTIIGQPALLEGGDFAAVKLSSRGEELKAAAKTLSPDQVQEFNRELLVAAFPLHVLAAPRGEGVLLLGGRTAPHVTENLILGWGRSGSYTEDFQKVPWQEWWPTIRLWGSLAAVFGLGILCLTLVVHPQWARRELLAFPVAQFVTELTDREPKALLPRVARAKGFWIAVGLVILIHLINGIKAWNPAFFLQIPRELDFWPLVNLFPKVIQAPQNWGLGNVQFYPTVIAFAFFLTTEVALSLGLSQFLWAIFSTSLVAYGVTMTGRENTAGPLEMISFGAYVGFALIILFVGRRHYWDVTKAAVGLRRSPETPASSVWGARGLVLSVALGAWILKSVGLDWALGILIILLIMLQMLVVARANAETGAIFIQTSWLPMTVLTTLLGQGAIGPTPYILLCMTSLVLARDLREAIMPQIINAVEISERTGKIKAQWISPGIGFMLVAALVVGIPCLIVLNYRDGLATSDSWSKNTVGKSLLNNTTAIVNDLSASGMLEPSMHVSGLEHFTTSGPSGTTLAWGAVGLGLVLATAVARLRLPWWPLHPVIFIFWCSMPCNRFWMSFLLGWLIKSSVVKLMGIKGYHMVKPIMVGVITGEILAIGGWLTAGTIYWMMYQTRPPVFNILPP